MQRLVSSCRALTSLPYRHTVPLRLPCRPLSTSTSSSSNTNEHTASTLSSASHPPTAAASSAGATTPSQPAAATATTAAATAPPNVNSPEEEEMRLNFLRLSQLMNGAVIEQPTPGITAEAQKPMTETRRKPLARGSRATSASSQEPIRGRITFEQVASFLAGFQAAAADSSKQQRVIEEFHSQSGVEQQTLRDIAAYNSLRSDRL